MRGTSASTTHWRLHALSRPLPLTHLGGQPWARYVSLQRRPQWCLRLRKLLAACAGCDGVFGLRQARCVSQGTAPLSAFMV